MPSLKQQFGRNLRKLRVVRELTQERLAEAAGISVDFLSLIERGRNSPSFETLEALSQALKLCVMDLFDFGQQPGRTATSAQKAKHR